MGNTATRMREAHAQAKSKPKTNRHVQEQKLKTAQSTGILSLAHSNLKTVPEEILQLVLLHTLDLTDNKLSEIPVELNGLTALKTLKLSMNKLATVPDLSTLDALTTLLLHNNLLSKIPTALPPHLVKLSLRSNRLDSIPCSVLQLSQLQELDVSENQLEHLPSDISDMHKLQELNVDGNQLTELPAALANCGNLKKISARRNRLRGRSAGVKVQCIAAELLGEGSAVQVLNLEDNPMTKEDLQSMDGFEAFCCRRMKLKNKELHGGLSSDLSLCGLN